MNASFAELLLPQLLLSLAMQGSSEGATITRQLSKHVFCKAAAGTAAVGLFLTALNRLRSFHLGALMQQKRRSKQDGPASQHSGVAAWSKASPFHRPFELALLYRELGCNPSSCSCRCIGWRCRTWRWRLLPWEAPPA